MAIKTIIKKEEEGTAEISLPYYSRNKDGKIFYKVFANDTFGALKLYEVGSRYQSIHKTLPEHAVAPDYEQCTEGEWQYAFNTAIELVQSIDAIKEVIETQPTTAEG